MEITRHLRIHGQVQGVFYRESTIREAKRLGVRGWVRNCSDGSVEAIVQGAPDPVEALIAWTSIGPERARVEDVVVSEGNGKFTRFERQPDA
ncbi:MAG: acylphosphatase [Thiobacillaceae bacterium]|jgi:acylphosphatase|nr:acylphosphatase [Thiobacillaceae bacterium]